MTLFSIHYINLMDIIFYTLYKSDDIVFNTLYKSDDIIF